MEFITYISKIMLEIMCEADIIKRDNTYILYKNQDSIYLAIYLTCIDSRQICAQYKWDEYKHLGKELADSIINAKVAEVTALFQHTFGLMATIHPNSILKEVKDIISFNGSSLEYQGSDYTDTILSTTELSLEKDFIQEVWFVKIGNCRISLNNEASARRIYMLVNKDIKYFIHMRWNLAK